jgi:DNA-binding NarL/FixJ family response regulator
VSADEAIPTTIIAITVVEDHPLYRDAVVAALSSQADMMVVQAVGALADMVQADPPPDVVLLDLNLPGVHGAEAVRRLSAHGLKVLVVSAQGERDDVVTSVAAGARGYITKHADRDHLFEAVRAVADGRSYVSATLASFLLGRQRRGAGASPALTAREREVLRLVACGETDQDIAKELTISVRTVRSHLDRIRDKTGRRRRPDMTLLAVAEGLIGSSSAAHS